MNLPQNPHYSPISKKKKKNPFVHIIEMYSQLLIAHLENSWWSGRRAR
jgi:hypothetical protein